MPGKSISAVTLGLSTILLFLFSTQALAERRYISDLMVVTLREGRVESSRVIGSATSNTPVDVLEESGEFVRVKTPDGKIGWIKKRYATTDTPKPIVIQNLEEKIAALQAESTASKAENGIAGAPLTRETMAQSNSGNAIQPAAEDSSVENKDAKIARLTAELNELKNTYASLLENSKNVSALMEKAAAAEETIKRLHAENSDVELLRQSFKEEKTHLIKAAMVRWFVAGAITLVIGVIIGRTPRKRDSYY